MATNCPICGKPENECTCGCCRPCPGTNPCVDMPRMSTPNYHLLLYRASDVTSWLIDYNNTMCTIDKILHGLALRTNTIDEVPQELVDAVEQLETDVAGLKQDVCNLTADNQNMSTQVANMQTAITNLQQAVQTLTFNTTNLDTRMTTAETAIQAVQNSLTKITENVNALVAEVVGLKKVDENLKTELDALAARVETLEDTAVTTAEAIQALNTQVQDLEERVTTLESSASGNDICMTTISFSVSVPANAGYNPTAASGQLSDKIPEGYELVPEYISGGGTTILASNTIFTSENPAGTRVMFEASISAFTTGYYSVSLRPLDATGSTSFTIFIPFKVLIRKAG